MSEESEVGSVSEYIGQIADPPWLLRERWYLAVVLGITSFVYFIRLLFEIERNNVANKISVLDAELEENNADRLELELEIDQNYVNAGSHDACSVASNHRMHDDASIVSSKSLSTVARKAKHMIQKKKEQRNTRAMHEAGFDTMNDDDEGMDVNETQQQNEHDLLFRPLPTVTKIQIIIHVTVLTLLNYLLLVYLPGSVVLSFVAIVAIWCLLLTPYLRDECMRRHRMDRVCVLASHFFILSGALCLITYTSLALREGNIYMGPARIVGYDTSSYSSSSSNSGIRTDVTVAFGKEWACGVNMDASTECTTDVSSGAFCQTNDRRRLHRRLNSSSKNTNKKSTSNSNNNSTTEPELTTDQEAEVEEYEENVDAEATEEVEEYEELIDEEATDAVYEYADELDEEYEIVEEEDEDAVEEAQDEEEVAEESTQELKDELATLQQQNNELQSELNEEEDYDAELEQDVTTSNDDNKSNDDDDDKEIIVEYNDDMMEEEETVDKDGNVLEDSITDKLYGEKEDISYNKDGSMKEVDLVEEDGESIVETVAQVGDTEYIDETEYNANGAVEEEEFMEEDDEGITEELYDADGALEEKETINDATGVITDTEYDDTGAVVNEESYNMYGVEEEEEEDYDEEDHDDIEYDEEEYDDELDDDHDYDDDYWTTSNWDDVWGEYACEDLFDEDLDGKSYDPSVPAGEDDWPTIQIFGSCNTCTASIVDYYTTSYYVAIAMFNVQAILYLILGFFLYIVGCCCSVSDKLVALKRQRSNAAATKVILLTNDGGVPA